jgi:DNA modification methylase
MNLVIEELKTLSEPMVDLTGFDKDLLIEPEDKDDEVPEVPVEPKSKLGDLYELGNHRVLCGDSTKIEDVDRLVNGAKIDLVYTDPPYGINLDGDNSKRGGESSIMKGGLKLKSFQDDTIDYAVEAFKICESLNIKYQIWWGANYYIHNLPQTNNWIIWDKRVEDKMTNTNSDAELAWVKDWRNGVRIFRHLWNGLIKASEKGEKRVHPTQKPVELARFCFDRYKEKNIINILDLFTGSGSTLIACEKFDKKFYGMEFDPHYVDVIVQRYVDYTGNNKIKLNGKEIIWQK